MLVGPDERNIIILSILLLGIQPHGIVISKKLPGRTLGDNRVQHNLVDFQCVCGQYRLTTDQICGFQLLSLPLALTVSDLAAITSLCGDYLLRIQSMRAVWLRMPICTGLQKSRCFLPCPTMVMVACPNWTKLDIPLE